MIKYIRLFLVTSFVLIAAIASAEELTGIGELKIGMSKNEFLETNLAKSKILSDKDSSMHVPNDKDLWRITVDSQLEMYGRVYSPDVEKYEFKMFVNLSDYGNNSYWTTAVFYKNKLAEIEISQPPPSIVDILTAKYGKPKTDNRTSSIVCQNKFGVRTQESKGERVSVWGSGKQITGNYDLYYLPCDKVLSRYIVKDVLAYKTLRQISEKGRAQFEKDEKKRKASNSSL